MAEMSLLQMAVEFCNRQGLPQPTSVVNATDDTTQQIYGLFNEGIVDICDRYVWPALINTVTFLHGDGENYAALDFGTTYTDFKALVPHTLWNTTTKQEVVGPIGPADWMAMTVMLVSPALYSYRLQANQLQIYPVANALHPFTMDYVSRFGTVNPVTATNQERYGDDTSYPRLPAYLVLQDIKWRWRMAKGLPYAEDQRTSEEGLMNFCNRLETGTLSMDGGGVYERIVGPGLFVATGSWNL